MKCQKCGLPLQRDDRFCPRCGQPRLSAAPKKPWRILAAAAAAVILLVCWTAGVFSGPGKADETEAAETYELAPQATVVVCGADGAPYSNYSVSVRSAAGKDVDGAAATDGAETALNLKKGTYHVTLRDSGAGGNTYDFQANVSGSGSSQVVITTGFGVKPEPDGQSGSAAVGTAAQTAARDAATKPAQTSASVRVSGAEPEMTGAAMTAAEPADAAGTAAPATAPAQTAAETAAPATAPAQTAAETSAATTAETAAETAAAGSGSAEDAYMAFLNAKGYEKETATWNGGQYSPRGYQFADIDQDGTPELFIYSNSDSIAFGYTLIYTCPAATKQVKLVKNIYSHGGVSLDPQDHAIAYDYPAATMSCGIVDYYELENGALRKIFSVGWERYTEQHAYYYDASGTRSDITEEQLEAYLARSNGSFTEPRDLP